jgi:hypothetical protein
MRRETVLGGTSSSRSAWTTIEHWLSARRGALALAVIVLASLAFRLHVSSECSLWLDEVSTLSDARKAWPRVLKGPSPEHPPLMYVLVKYAISFLGDSETAVRSVSLFFGCVLLVALHELCLVLGTSVKRALIVTGSYALSPFFIRHATEARQYAMLAAFATLAAMFVLRVLRGPPRTRDVAGFAMSALAAAWTHYFGLAYALALLAALVVGIVPVWKRWRVLQRVQLVGLLLGLLVLLGFVAARAAALGARYSTSTGGMADGPILNTRLLAEIAGDFSPMLAEAWSFAIAPPLAFVGLALLSWRLRGVARLLPFGIGAVPCVAALFISSRHFVAARYLAPSAVFYHLGFCAALFAALDRVRVVLAQRARSGFLSPVLGGLVFAALLGARLREFPNGFGAGADYYQGLQRYFVDHLAQDTRLVAYYGYFGRILFGKEYHLGSPPISLEKFRRVRGIDRYLVVEIHVGEGDRRDALEKLVKRHFGLSPEAWRALPLVPLPHSLYQPAVAARLVQLPSKQKRKRH